MFLDAIRSLRGAGASVEVILPRHGRLAERLESDFVPVHTADFPILRRSLLSVRPLGALAAQAWPTVRGLAASIRSLAPDVVYVNTITLPHWMAAGRKAGVGVICHVHELDQLPGPLASVLLSPLLLADRLVVNSQATQRYVRSRLPRVGPRVSLVYNGFDMPAALPSPPAFGRTRRLLLVGRLSPRKGQDLAIEALSLLVQWGHDVVLELVGDTFDGYEWYEEALRRQAASLGLTDRVEFGGYQIDTSSAYARSDVVLVPSTLESFGNVAVEGLAAGDRSWPPLSAAFPRSWRTVSTASSSHPAMRPRWRPGPPAFSRTRRRRRTWAPKVPGRCALVSGRTDSPRECLERSPR